MPTNVKSDAIDDTKSKYGAGKCTQKRQIWVQTLCMALMNSKQDRKGEKGTKT